MIIPIRCTSCGKVIAHLWEEYNEKVQKSYNEKVSVNNSKRIIDIKDAEESDEKRILDEMGFKRYCCRRMMLSHIDLCDKL